MTTATARTDANVVWTPHPGSQTLFLSCPFRECLYTGTRGPGKTDALLMDFAQHIGQGFGAHWRGILFREESTQLKEVRAKAQRWFPRIFPGARYIGPPKDMWVFPEGEELYFGHAKRRRDYDKYHGWEIPWIGWEELTNWPDLTLYHLLKSINRTTTPGVPLKIRATCNPYGRGHNAVKAYFIDPAPAGVPFVPSSDEISDVLADIGADFDVGQAHDSAESWKAVTLHGHYSENVALMEADPDYPGTIARSAENPEQAKAWLADDWDIVSGGMFDDVWSRQAHVLPDFEIPAGWTVFRAHDWGQSKPFSFGWWARANGEAAELPDGRTFCPPRGSLVRVGEFYGWDGKTPNVGLRLSNSDMGRQAAEIEDELFGERRIHAGPADASIFDDNPGETSPADAFKAHGLKFIPSDKSPGSRVRGWSKMRDMLAEAAKTRPEEPGMWVTERCRQFIRTIPTLPRSDSNPDDADTDAEDHIADETRYVVLAGETAPADTFDFRLY